MKKQLCSILKCPNSGSTDFSVFGCQVRRNDQILNSLRHESIQEDDDILEGILTVADSDVVYPIRHGIPSLLNRNDVNVELWSRFFATLREYVPWEFASRIELNLDRISKAGKSADKSWNLGEMKYYDDAVDSKAKQDQMRDAVSSNYLGRTFFPRKKVILDPLRERIQGKTLLEIGCGTARTIATLLPPADHHYSYVGVDISYYRLVVAKSVQPAAEFIQASAIDMPLQAGIADIGLAFGAIHHLPRHREAIQALANCLRDEAYLGIHEPVVTPKLITGKVPFLERLFFTYEHSERDGEVELEELTETLRELGFDIRTLYRSISPFRTLMEHFVRLMSSHAVIESPSFAGALYQLDEILIRSLCRFSKALSPRAATVLAARCGTDPFVVEMLQQPLTESVCLRQFPISDGVASTTTCD